MKRILFCLLACLPIFAMPAAAEAKPLKRVVRAGATVKNAGVEAVRRVRSFLGGCR